MIKIRTVVLARISGPLCIHEGYEGGGGLKALFNLSNTAGVDGKPHKLIVSSLLLTDITSS